MVIVPVRLLGLLLLTLAIVIPSCQAVVSQEGDAPPFRPGFVQDR